MKIPNFRTRQGSELYTMTAGHRIAPLVAEALAERVIAAVRADDSVAHLLDVACGPGMLALRLARELPLLRSPNRGADRDRARPQAKREPMGQRARPRIVAGVLRGGA